MNKAVLVSTALVGLLFAAVPAFANSVGGCTVPGCTGDVEASGGTTGTTTVGDTASGTLTITGAYTTGTLTAGSLDGSSGTVTITTTGTLSDDAIIGDAGAGTFTNNNIHNVTGNLILGNQSTGTGTYTITGSSAQTIVNFAGTAGGSPPETPNGALIVGYAGTGNFTQETVVGSDATPTVNVAGDVALGLQSGSTGIYTLNDGTLTVGGVMIVGAASTNANLFTQNGGTVSVTGSAIGNSLYATVSPGAVPSTSPGILYIGGESVSDNGTGTYTLTGGTLSASIVEVGFSGTGTVNHSGGSVNAAYLDLGGCGGCNGGNSAGFYNLSGNGTIVVGAETVGDVGHGEFVQGADGHDATVNTVNGTLAVGNAATATPNTVNPGSYDRSGTYTLDSGALNTQYTDVGNAGTGAFIQSGGTHAIVNTLTIGAQNSQPMSGPAGSGTPTSPVFGGPAPGTYTMTGGTVTAGGDQSVGNDTSGAGIIVGDAGNGTFNQIGGSVTSGVLDTGSGGQRGNLLISAQAGSTGTYNLGDSTSGAPTLQVYGDATIGRDAAGSVTVSDGLGDGGTVTVPLGSSNGTLAIAGNGTAMSVNQYTGFDSHNGGNMVVGLNGTGAVTQTDASSLFTDHNVVLGANAGSSGSYTLNATSLGGGQSNLFVGSDLNIGGMTSLTDIYDFNLQTTVNGGTGTFNLKSGDLATAGAVNVGNNDGTGTLNISGGTLTAGNGMNIGVNDFTISNDTTGNVDRSSATGGGSGTVTQTAGAVTVGGPTTSTALNLGTTANSLDPTTGTYTITGVSTLDVYGNADIGVSTGATGTMTIGSGLDSPTVNIHSTGAGDGNMTVSDAGTGKLTVNSGALSIDGGLSIGVNGTGTVLQTGGTVTASIVDMNTPVGAGSASYTISGGTLHSTGDLNVGGAGAGPVAFSESGDSTTVNVDGTLRVGNFSNTGSYTLTGGTLNVGGDSVIGNDSLLGTMSQSGGSHLVNGTLTLGDGTGSSGLYTLSGGTLTSGITGGSTIGDVVIGNNGTGELDNSGGVQKSESVDGFTLGFESGSQGTYKLTGTGSLSVAANENIGVFGTGTFLQGDGGGNTSNTVGGSLYISSGSGGPASSYTLTDGTLTVTGSEVVGFAAQGSFTQSGGINNANGGLTLGLLNNAPTDPPTQFGNGTYTLGGSGTLNVGGDLVLGSATGTSGTFNYNTASGDAATLSFTGSGQTLVVGDSGTGVFNEGSTTNTTDLNLQTSGTTLNIGRSVGGNGTFNLAAGSSLEDDAIVGDAGTGTFNNAGGTHNVSGSLTLGNQSTGNGTYNLTGGGTTTVSSFTTVGAAGTGTFLNDASTLNSQGALTLGAQSGSNGQFTLQNGGTVNVGVTGAAAFIDVAESGTGTYTQTSGTTTIIGAFDIGRCGAVATATCNNGSNPYTGATGNGTVNLSGGSISVQFDPTTDAGAGYGGFTKVGDAGNGTLNISGGASFTSVSLDLATDGGTGIVTLNGSTSTVTLNTLGVGDTGQGTFTQNAGTVTISAGLGIGNAAAGTSDGFATLPAGNGEYDLNGGSLSVTGGEFVGEAGTGTFKQTAGTNHTDTLTIGNNTGGTGTYDLSGTGKLTDAGTLYVGASGNGTLNQSGGTATATATGLSVGNNAGGTGNYNLSAGSVTISGDTFLGGDTGAQGTITQTGGTAALNGNVNVGFASNATGTYTLGGTGAATITGNLDIGVAANSNGTFNFNTTTGDAATLNFATSGSKMTVGDAGTGTVNQGGGDLNLTAQGITLDIAVQANSTGHYNVTGGTLEDDLIVGDAGTGTFTNTGGVHTVTGNLIIGNQSTGVGTYTLGGTGNLTLSTAGAQVIIGNAAGASGTFNFNISAGDTGTATFSGTGDQIIVGNSGSGVFNQSGGTLNLSGNGAGMDIAANANSFGQYNLHGGTLETGPLNVGDGGSGQFNQSGGTATISGDLVAANQIGSAGVISIGGPGATSLTVTGNATIGNNGFGSFGMGTGATVDVQGSMTIGASSAGGSAAIEGGALTVGDGGSGNELLITSNGSMKIEDTGGVGASVTVDGTLVNDGQLALGLHTVTPSATLTVTNGFQNNGGFNFEANSILNSNVTNAGTFSAQNGGGTNVTLNGNMSNSGTVNVSELGLTAPAFTQNGTFTNNAAGAFTVEDGAVTINGGSGDSLDNAGRVTFENDPNSGTTPAFAPSIVGLNGNVTNTGSGVINVQGSNVTITGNGGGNPALNNAATLNIGNGSNSLGSIFTVNGSSTNSGTISVTNSTARWNGAFTNNGAYHSDPSANYFTDLTVGANGYLTGGAGDLFNVSGNFHNTSTQSTLWNTSASTLEYSGTTGTSHTMDLVGLDEGPNGSGFTNNYAWGLLDLDSGNSLSLDGTVGTNALYVAALEGLDISGDDITNIFGNGLNIYYNPADDAGLGDLTYALGDGGFLCPIGASTCTVSTLPPPPQVPEPGSMLLLGGGLAGLAFVRRRVARSRDQALTR